MWARSRYRWAASTAFGEGPSGFSFEAILTISSMPSSLRTSSIGFPGTYAGMASTCSGTIALTHSGGFLPITFSLPSPMDNVEAR